MAEYIEREAKCKNCVHTEACLFMLKTLTFSTDEQLERAANRKTDCPLFKPTADVVEVVRCKECNRYSKGSRYGYGWCHLIECEFPDNHYCSYGVRKGEGE